MQLRPRYGDDPIVRLEVPIESPAEPLVRQRDRLGALVGTLDHDQWAAPSRCDGWSVQDVLAHLVSTNQFWAFSIASARQGKPTEFLASFDPVATPQDLVAGKRVLSPAETLGAYAESVTALRGSLDGIAADEWALVGESPVGHVSLSLVVLHALWDAWIHERDIAVPLGLEQTQEPDEVLGCLLYVSALSPGFAVMYDTGQRGALDVQATEPEARFVVEVGTSVTIRGGSTPDDAALVRGDAATLVEALSLRVPLDLEVAARHRWMFDGLPQVFDADLESPPDSES